MRDYSAIGIVLWSENIGLETQKYLYNFFIEEIDQELPGIKVRTNNTCTSNNG